MDMKMLLPAEHVLMGLADKDRMGILTVLVEPLVRADVVRDALAFLDDLLIRESQVSTQVPGGVAFPHARSAHVSRLGLTVGLAPAPGLPFDRDQPELCRVFFLIAVPATSPTAHLPLLNLLSRLVRKDNKKRRLLNASSVGDVTRVIRTFKG